MFDQRSQKRIARTVQQFERRPHHQQPRLKNWPSAPGLVMELVVPQVAIIALPATKIMAQGTCDVITRTNSLLQSASTTIEVHNPWQFEVDAGKLIAVVEWAGLWIPSVVECNPEDW